jgi:hypothetical protein
MYVLGYILPVIHADCKSFSSNRGLTWQTSGYGQATALAGSMSVIEPEEGTFRICAWIRL